MIKYLFFDFDGTICDSKSSAIVSIIRALDEYGYEIDHSEIIPNLGDKIHIALKKLKINPGHLDAVVKRFYKIFRKENLSNIKPCNSLKHLADLSKKFPLIIISNSETKHIKIALKRMGIRKIFKKIYGAEKFDTKDKMLTKLFKKFRIKPREAVYIGDRYSDIRYAKKAKCISIAVSNKCSWSNKTTLRKEKPDYVVRDFGELKKLLKKI